MGDTMAIGELHSRAVAEVTTPSDLQKGDRIVCVARDASYSADHRFPVYTVDTSGSARVDGADEVIDFGVFRVYKLPH
jgi:hypothetical protein